MMKELFEALKPYLDEPHEYKQHDYFWHYRTNPNVKTKLFRMDFIRRHQYSKRLHTFLRIDYDKSHGLYRVELRMAFKVLGITFTRKLAGLDSPYRLDSEVRPYLIRAEAIVAKASLQAKTLAREKAENSSSDKMIKAIRNVLQ